MTEKQLLILHNGTTPDGAQPFITFFEQMGVSAISMWAAGGQFPSDPTQFSGCVLTGSPHGAYEPLPWIKREHAFITTHAQHSIPMLGVCFGSQILASALCGRDQLFRRASCEVGFLHLPFTKAGRQDALTRHLNNAIDMFVWHNDEIRATHKDMVILASSDACPNQIWRYRDQLIWGIQGHPELTTATAAALFDAELATFERDGADITQLKATAHDAPEAKTLLSRFAEIVQSAP